MATSGASSEVVKLSQEDEALVPMIYRYYSNDALQAKLEDEKLAAIIKQIHAIRDFAKEQFPLQSILTDEDLVILSMSIFAPHPSPEKAIVATNRSYIEVKRALSRLYCILLLQMGAEGYKAFVACQPKDTEFSPPLSQDQFLQLASKYQGLDKLTLDTLKVATLISSVPLSQEARKRANKIFGKDNYVVDSVEFPALVFENMEIARQVYPQVEYLWQQCPNADDRKKIAENLQSAFAHRRHYRHMLYTEGTYTMFNNLVDDIQQGKLSKSAYDFWILYWNTNITGFQGNVDPAGSYYLTANTYRAMSALEAVLDSIFEDNQMLSSAILSSYLTQRAAFLGLGDIKNTRLNLNMKEQEFLAHIGAMMRLYVPEQGAILSASYLACKSTVAELRKDFFHADKDMPTPTYAPALFANVRDCLHKRYDEEKVFQSVKKIQVNHLSMTATKLKDMLAIFETIILCMPLYVSALQQYKRLRSEGKIAPNVPLSFQSISDPQWITQLFDKSIFLDKVNILDLVDITVSEKGVVGYTKRQDYDARLKAQLTEQMIEPPKPAQVFVPGYQATLASSSPAVVASATPTAQLGIKPSQ